MMHTLRFYVEAICLPSLKSIYCCSLFFYYYYYFVSYICIMQIGLLVARYFFPYYCVRRKVIMCVRDAYMSNESYMDKKKKKILYVDVSFCMYTIHRMLGLCFWAHVLQSLTSLVIFLYEFSLIILNNFIFTFYARYVYVSVSVKKVSFLCCIIASMQTTQIKSFARILGVFV